MVSSGQNLVKPLWNRLTPTNAVNHSQLAFWNRGLPSTPSASDSMTKKPANTRTH